MPAKINVLAAKVPGGYDYGISYIKFFIKSSVEPSHVLVPLAGTFAHALQRLPGIFPLNAAFRARKGGSLSVASRHLRCRLLLDGDNL